MRQSADQHCGLTLQVAMHADAPYFVILLCLTPGDFTCQRESVFLPLNRLSEVGNKQHYLQGLLISEQILSISLTK
jgi:hypothetical protein